MNTGPIQTFSNVSPVRWAIIKSAVQAKTDIAVTSDSGTASSKGVTLRWSYIPNTLEVQVMDRKFYDPSESDLEADIAAIVSV